MAIKPMSLLAGLPPEKLRWRCDPATIPFETTAEAELVTTSFDRILGQQKANDESQGIRLVFRSSGCGARRHSVRTGSRRALPARLDEVGLPERADE
jgi:hypothetical protein